MSSLTRCCHLATCRPRAWRPADGGCRECASTTDTIIAPLQQPDDALIVEGYGVHAPRFAGITVYATQVTTKALQAAKRTEQTRAPINAE